MKLQWIDSDFLQERFYQVPVPRAKGLVLDFLHYTTVHYRTLMHALQALRTQANKSDPSEQRDKSDQSDQSDQSDKSDKSDQSDQSDKSDKSDKNQQTKTAAKQRKYTLVHSVGTCQKR
ncbi:hypothetical protein ACMFMF_000052 [Clarireedia jacksonii]